MCNALPYEATIDVIDMDQINILLSNRKKLNLNASHRKDQSPPYMVLPDLKAEKFDEFDPFLSWSDKILVGTTNIPIYYVLR